MLSFSPSAVPIYVSSVLWLIIGIVTKLVSRCSSGKMRMH